MNVHSTVIWGGATTVRTMPGDAAEPTVLVTGATGTVGSRVVDRLADRPARVRAAARVPEAARARFGDAVDVVRFDFTKPETWGPAFEGTDALFLVRPPAMGRVGRHLTPAVDAAARVGVDRVVLLSVLGAETVPVLPHRRVEKHLVAADVAATFLRSSFFAQNLGEVHRRDVVERDELFVPAGDGATSFVDARDVAAVAARALTEPGHAGRAYDVTGLEALTYHEVARIFSEVLGREVTYPAPGALAFARRHLARGEAPAFVLAMVGIYTTVRLGLADRVTDDVRRVLGREPRTLRNYVEDDRETFASADHDTPRP